MNTNNGENQLEANADFADLLDQYEYVRPKQGQIIQGEVLRIEDDAIFMDVGAKRDAIVPHTDLDYLDESYVSKLETGSEIPVYVLKDPVGDEELLVSINKGLQQKDWDQAETFLETEEALELEITGYNKGGLLVQFGQLQGFVPNSHVPQLRYGGNTAQIESAKARMVGETLLVKVLEVDQQRRRLIFSAKAPQKEQRKRRLRELEVGSVITGRVANIVKYGGFVELGGGVSGLLHVSELAWYRVDHPSEILTEGEEVEVQIQDVDVERERVSLSRKAVLPNPWDTIEERYNIGDLIEGTVTNIEDFGAFVEVQNGVVGLVHVSEIDIYGPATINDILQPSDNVLVRIIDIDPYEERLSLSLRRVTSEEQIEWMRQHDEESDEAEEVATAEAPVETEDAAEIETAEPAAETDAVTSEESEVDESEDRTSTAGEEVRGETSEAVTGEAEADENETPLAESQAPVDENEEPAVEAVS